MASPDETHYNLPNWFLERNVRTAEDLIETPNQIVFCDCNDCKDVKIHDNTCFEIEDQPGDNLGSVQEKNILAETPDKMHYKKFVELRDVTCASFIPLHDGKLKRDSIIVFRMEEEGARTPTLEPAWMSRVVLQLAKASKAISLIYLDLETLEELGNEFHLQDKKKAEEGASTDTSWEPDMNSFTTFLEHFFAVPPKANADQKSWERRHRSLSAVLDAPGAASGARFPEGDSNDAVLVHIMMDCTLANEVLERRVLERFAEVVLGRREAGQPVAILLSTKCPTYSPGRDNFRRIGGTEDLTVTAVNDKPHDSDRRKKLRTGIINTQRMRRFIRLRLLSNLFSTDLLTFSSDWASADRGRTYESFGKELWSESNMTKAITLLMGRSWRLGKSGSQITFTDIQVVLECMDLFCQVESEAQDQISQQASGAGEFP